MANSETYIFDSTTEKWRPMTEQDVAEVTFDVGDELKITNTELSSFGAAINSNKVDVNIKGVEGELGAAINSNKVDVNIKGVEGESTVLLPVKSTDAGKGTAVVIDIAANNHALGSAHSSLWVGGGGDVKVTMSGGGDVTFSSVPAGSHLPISITHVIKTGTTATNMVALK